MALPARFALLNSNLDAFLFASIGQEESGMSLSVASALARLGTDPWIEAERLTQLPRAKAAEALAAMIARIPMASWKPSDAPTVAAGLIQLLPGRETNPSKPEARHGESHLRRSHKLTLLICLALIALAAFAMLVGR